MNRDKRLQENLKENLEHAFPIENIVQGTKKIGYPDVLKIAYNLVERTRTDEHQVASTIGVPKKILEILLDYKILILNPQDNICMPGPHCSRYYGIVDTETLNCKLRDDPSENKKR